MINQINGNNKEHKTIVATYSVKQFVSLRRLNGIQRAKPKSLHYRTTNRSGFDPTL
jgi:hypothetical protein